MTQVPPFLENPDDTREAIMKATYVALCKHGYNDLTTHRIGDEFSKSKSLLYHHYESKDDLLIDFLGFMLDRFEAQFPAQEKGGYEEHIEEIAHGSFDIEDPEADLEFMRAIVDFRAQAAHNEQFRDYFAQTDNFVRKYLAHTIRAGIERGVFREVDPQETAALLLIVVTGSMIYGTTGSEDMLEDAGNAFDRFIQEYLVKPEEARE